MTHQYPSYMQRKCVSISVWLYLKGTEQLVLWNIAHPRHPKTKPCYVVMGNPSHGSSQKNDFCLVSGSRSKSCYPKNGHVMTTWNASFWNVFNMAKFTFEENTSPHRTWTACPVSWDAWKSETAEPKEQTQKTHVNKKVRDSKPQHAWW